MRKAEAAKLLQKCAEYMQSDEYVIPVDDFMLENCIYYDSKDYSYNFRTEKCRDVLKVSGLLILRLF